MIFPFVHKAQNTNALGTWTILHVKGKLYKNLLFFVEGQLRSQSFYNKFYYYEAKGALGYAFNKNISVYGGGGHYETYPTAGNFTRPLATSEWRSWEEVNLTQSLWRVIIDQRFRVEQRWLNTLGYRNRFRCRISLLLPLNKPTIDNNTVYLLGGDEPFFTTAAPYFERNRVFAGVGYKFNKLTLQVAWFNQYDYKLTGDTEKNFFQLLAVINIGAKPVIPQVPLSGD